MPDISIDAADGSGSFSAYCATPASGSGPGVVVLQEIFGVNQVMRDLCDGFAAEGYIAVAPDLFWRIEPDVQLTDKSQKEWDKAFELMNAFLPDFEKGVGDIAATIGHVRGMEGCTGKVGAVGRAYREAIAVDHDFARFTSGRSRDRKHCRRSHRHVEPGFAPRAFRRKLDPVAEHRLAQRHDCRVARADGQCSAGAETLAGHAERGEIDAFLGRRTTAACRCGIQQLGGAQRTRRHGCQ